VIETHPVADIWPLMSDPELARLAEDIAQRGQVLPIILVNGKILDGRNRWRACELAGVEPWTEEIETDDPGALAWSLNEHRRHAPLPIRAEAAMKLADMPKGWPSNTASQDAVSQTAAAERYGVGRATVQRIKTVHEFGDPRLIEMVRSGDESIRLAAKTVHRLKETGQQITSVGELKTLMRQIYREDNPLPEPPPRQRDEATMPPDHIGVDTFGVVRAIVRHAEQCTPADAAARIDKWTKLNIQDDLPPAIAYLTALRDCLGD
jgi:ParB-like chromosome segregation protein Spo0J